MGRREPREAGASVAADLRDALAYLEGQARKEGFAELAALIARAVLEAQDLTGREAAA